MSPLAVLPPLLPVVSPVALTGIAEGVDVEEVVASEGQAFGERPTAWEARQGAGQRFLPATKIH